MIKYKKNIMKTATLNNSKKWTYMVLAQNPSNVIRFKVNK